MKIYDSHKDSGIEWIGKIPEHWNVKKLKYVASINDDVLSERTEEDFEIEYVDISSIGSNVGIIKTETFAFKDAPSRARRLVNDGDIIVSTVRTYLKAIAKIEKPKPNLVVSTGFAVVRPRSVMSNYTGHLFYHENLLGEIISRSVGVSYPAINSTEIGTIPIPLPPPTEQTAIAKYLDRKTAEIDELIADKKRLVELYEEEKTAIINQAVTKGINPDAPMKDSGIEWLGEIPRHWEVKRLKYLVAEKLKYGANESAEEENRDNPRYIRITDFGNDGKLKEDTFKSLPPEKANEYLLSEGDVLFARSGATVGKTFQFKDYKGIACFAGYLIKATPNSYIITSDYLYYFTRTGAYENWKSSIFNQATIQNIGADKYALLEISTPETIKEQQAIVHHIESECARIDAKKSRTEKLIDLLTEYRTALISEVVTGKIKVSE